jgi:5-methylcytosine-specific restriction endonuclease McrA
MKPDFFVTPQGIVFPISRPLSERKRWEIYIRDGKKCVLCGRPVRFGGNTASPLDVRGRASHTDHIFPRSRGGQNEDDNLRLLCIRCNTSKGARI